MSENAKAKILDCEFEFKCPKNWENLAQTYLDDVRFCKSCGEKVYFVEDQEILDKMRDEGKCVAFSTEEIAENEVIIKSRVYVPRMKRFGVGRPKRDFPSENDIFEKWNNTKNSDK